MHFYDVSLNLHCHGCRIGRTSVQIPLRAASPFIAARKAEKTVNARYRQGINSRTISVNPISEEEFYYEMAA